MTKNSQNVKKRNWAFVAYPESMPSNWLEILQKTGLKIAVSPLHDKDKNADEEEKKAHYHIILCWESGTVRYTQAEKIAKSINGTFPIPLESIRGYYRYFTHKDNPEKYQYSEKDIQCLNGFAVSDFIELTKSEVSKIKREIRELIYNNGICEYSDLMQYLDNEGVAERIEVAENNTIHFDALLRSIRCKNMKN